LKRKVFCIGFSKTGTTSLRDALTRLGYRVTGPNGHLDPDIEQKMDALTTELSTKYDAFQDNPWPLVYRKMDAMYPGSRFILTVRDPDKWLSSVVRHFGVDETPIRTVIYGFGSPIGHEDLYRDRMVRHDQEVLEYFKERPDDLLVIDITKAQDEENWGKICGFLGEPIPAVPFPHSNTAQDRGIRKKYRKWGWPGRLAARVAFAVGIH
jgi:hypothetical protein